MDTKFQSKVFSGLLILGAIICLAFSLMTSLEKKIDLQESNMSYIKDSPEIRDMVLRYAKNLQRYYIYYANFDLEKAEQKLSEIDSYTETGKIERKQSDYSLTEKPYIADNIMDGDSSDNETENDVSVAQPENLYNFNIKDVTVDALLDYQSKLSDAISNYKSVKEYIVNNNDFHFILYSNKLGHLVATNSDVFYNEECYDSITLTDGMFNTTFNGETLSNSFRNNGLSCEISIPVTTSNNVKVQMNTLHRQLSNNKIFASKIVTLVLLGIAIMLISFVLLYDKESAIETNKKIICGFAKIPMVIKIPIMVAIIEALIKAFERHSSAITEMVIKGYVVELVFTIFTSIFTIVFTFLFIEEIIFIIKDKTRIMHIPDIQFIARGVNDCKLVFSAGKIFFGICMTVIQVAIICLGCVLFILMSNMYMFIPYILIILFLILLLVILYNGCSSEVKLRYFIQQMANGHMEVVPEQKGMFIHSIGQLNEIRENFQKNLDENLKSERLKTDLITNVSHDLKTPLTSIISYVDLLSNMENNSDEAKEYIEIIKNKSRRLKTLIDDLFEASKLSSGQMKLERMDSDIVSLLEQTLGELDYKIESAGIEFVVTKNVSPIIVNMDGERMWRVFDNLINNILKYSPKDSRAYIDILDKDEQVEIVFKNVANYHMEFNADELFERFKRGDIARTTEGSGLGLSIARSIVELHGGTMNIVTDGDLFKIKVVLNKKEKIEDNN